MITMLLLLASLIVNYILYWLFLETNQFTSKWSAVFYAIPFMMNLLLSLMFWLNVWEEMKRWVDETHGK